MKKDLIIEKSVITHNNKYNYELLLLDQYKLNDYINIICPIHGTFEQKVKNHIYGNGCKKCSNDKLSKSKRLNHDEFIKKVRLKHNNKYDYSKTKYIDGRNKIKIICPIHGVFEQIAKIHLYGSGCKECNYEKYSNDYKYNSEEFKKQAKLIHNDYYNYSLVDYHNNLTNIVIICPIHGEYNQKPRDHIQGSGCSKCSKHKSNGEKELITEINSWGIKNIIENDRNLLNGKELDIYLPDYNIAIEYNGLYWHTSKFLRKNYHLDKFLLCSEKGIRLIQIFEDEWIYKKEIIISKLKSIFNKSDSKRIFGRKCEIDILSSKIFNRFLDNHHIQGHMNCKVRYGLFYEGELVSVIGFRYDKKRGWDLNRFASKYQVVGGFSKLLKHFIKHNKPKKIFTFADLRYSDKHANVYTKNGFKEIGITKPNFYYTKGNMIRYSRIQYQKHKLKCKLENYDDNLTAIDNMIKNEYYRIFDCGNIKYEITF